MGAHRPAEAVEQFEVKVWVAIRPHLFSVPLCLCGNPLHKHFSVTSMFSVVNARA